MRLRWASWLNASDVQIWLLITDYMWLNLGQPAEPEISIRFFMPPAYGG